MTDDEEKSRTKDKVKKILICKDTKRSVKRKRSVPLPELVNVISKMPNITIVQGKTKSLKTLHPSLNNTTTVTKVRSINITLEKNESPPGITEKDMHFCNIEAFLAHSTATPIRSHDGFAYTCCFCNEHYVNPADLKTHTLTKHNNVPDIREFMKRYRPDAFLIKLDITLLKCKECDESIDTVDGLFDHLQNEHKKLLYKDVKNQIIPFKFGGEELQCAICYLTFNKYKILVEHMNTHYRNYVCENCDLGFISRRSLSNHQETHKTGSYECSKCNKVFENPQSRRTHMNAIHRYKSFPSKCGICKERFKSGPLKDQHMIDVHGMSPIIRKCLACDKTFTSQHSLRKHTKKDHLLERDFQCTECEMTFFTKAQLKNHMLKHTGRKDFQCDVCFKWFGRKCVLTEHMRIHKNDRRFTCLQCGRGFVQKCSWRGHMRTVHGEIDDNTISSA